MIPGVRVAGWTTQRAGVSSVLDAGTAFLAAVVLLAHLAEVLPTVRAAGGTVERRRRTASPDQRAAFLALVIAQRTPNRK